MIKNLGQIVDSGRESLTKIVTEAPSYGHYEIQIHPPNRGSSAGLVDMVGSLIGKSLDPEMVYDPIETTAINSLIANICPEDGRLRVIFSRES